MRVCKLAFFIEIFQINQLHTDLHNSILKNSLLWIPKKCMSCNEMTRGTPCKTQIMSTKALLYKYGPSKDEIKIEKYRKN